MDQEPKITPTLEQKPVLSFNEFCDRTKNPPSTIPRYNNFFFYFLPGPTGDSYRRAKHFLRFLSEHPDLNILLCEKMNNIDDSSDSLLPYEPNLYEAYKIMRGYGVSDGDLFV